MELVKQGQKLSSTGKQDEATALFQRALDLDPDLYDAQLYMGVSLDLQAKYEEATRQLSTSSAPSICNATGRSMPMLPTPLTNWRESIWSPGISTRLCSGIRRGMPPR